MTRSIGQRVDDILAAIDRCRRYAGSLDDGDSLIAEMATDAIERSIQIIGEASTHLPVSITEAHPEVNWPAIRGMRNIIVHEYFGVDPSILRDVITNHLGTLESALMTYGASNSARD